MAEWKWDPTREAWRLELWSNGRRTKLTFKGTKKEALAYEARRRLELDAEPQATATARGTSASRTAPAFASFCVETYKPHAKATLRASTWDVRRYQLEPLIAFFGSRPLSKITTADVEAYKQQRSQSVGKVTVNSELTVLGAVLAYARHVNVPCASPKLKRYPERQRKGKVRFYTRDEVACILTAAQEIGPDFYALVRFIAETGARRSEALALQRSRLDLDAGMVRIWSDASGDVDGDEGYETKSRDREVTLPDGLVAVLRAHTARLPPATAWVFPVPCDHVSEIVRLKADGWKSRDVAEACGCSWQYVNRVWKKYADAPPPAGPPERYAAWPKATWARCLRMATERRQEADPKARPIVGGPHRLRHTFASLFLQARPDLFALGRVLGHSHTRVTELYSHLLPDHLAATRGLVTFDLNSTPPVAVKGRNPTQNPTQEKHTR